MTYILSPSLIGERLLRKIDATSTRHAFLFHTPIFYYPTSLVAWWSELPTTKHEVPGSIPGSTMCVFP